MANLREVYAIVDGLETVVANQEARIAQLVAQLEEAQSKPRGGKGSGKKWSEEQKANLKRVMQGRAHKWTEEERAALSETMKATFAAKKARMLEALEAPASEAEAQEGGSAEAPLFSEEALRSALIDDEDEGFYWVGDQRISVEEWEREMRRYESEVWAFNERNQSA